MNQKELIHAIAAETGESKAAIGRVLKALGQVVHASVRDGVDVSIPAVGKIGTTWRAPRVVRQIKNGRRMRIGGRFVPVIRPSSALKATAENRTDQHWKHPEHQRAWRIAESLVGDLELYHGSQLPKLDVDQPTAVRQACGEALGEAWKRAEETFARDIPADVRDAHDYLASAAFERWCQ